MKKKKLLNWQAVDWQKTNKELAKDLSYTARHIANKRKELGIANPPYKGFKDWESLDWSLPNTVLAEQIGYSTAYITEKRKELGKPPRRKPSSPETTKQTTKRINAFNRGIAEVWDDVDWTKPDREISEQINRTISSVGKKRKELGIAPVRVYDADRWRNMDWSKSNQEIMQETGVSITTVCTNRAKFAPSQHKKPKKIRIDWKKVDWSLTSQEIAEKFGYHLNYVRAKRKEFDKKSKKKLNCLKLKKI